MRIALFILIVLAGFACKNKAQIAQEERTESALPLTPSDPAPTPERIQTDQTEPSVKNLGIVTKPEFVPNTEMRPVNMESIEIIGDSLFITVNFSGGCKNHVFNLTHTGAYMESMPPILDIYLEHEDNGDACRALITEKLGFDLTQLRYSSEGPLTLRLYGLREPLRYEY